MIDFRIGRPSGSVSVLILIDHDGVPIGLLNTLTYLGNRSRLEEAVQSHFSRSLAAPLESQFKCSMILREQQEPVPEVDGYPNSRSKASSSGRRQTWGHAHWHHADLRTIVVRPESLV